MKVFNVLRYLWVYIRFGKLHPVPKAYVAGVISEIEYVDASGIVRGYWAYGYFDPNLPYQGNVFDKGNVFDL